MHTSHCTEWYWQIVNDFPFDPWPCVQGRTVAEFSIHHNNYVLVLCGTFASYLQCVPIGLNDRLLRRQWRKVFLRWPVFQMCWGAWIARMCKYSTPLWTSMSMSTWKATTASASSWFVMRSCKLWMLMSSGQVSAVRTQLTTHRSNIHLLLNIRWLWLLIFNKSFRNVVNLKFKSWTSSPRKRAWRAHTEGRACIQGI